jgi:ribosomal protein S18 acetylase RimI-like enzyme
VDKARIGASVMLLLRPASTDDTEFLWRVQRSALGPYVTVQFGTNEAQQRAFFDRHFDVPAHQIVRVNGTDAGYLAYRRREDHVYLVNVALLPRFQSRGIGSLLIRRVLNEADASGLPVRLRVLRSNARARDLYARFGFAVTGHTADHYVMTREAV